jgi:homoserine dehydrogenase
VPRELLSTNLWDAINEPAELVIELTGAVQTVGEVVHAALLGERTVITANKALVAQRWRQLGRFAAGSNPRLRFSAAVGGEVPVLETVQRLASRSAIARVRGVINGTCNFILDRLEAGVRFDDAVREAQARGFAEADPRADLSGEDAAHKLELIARTAFHRGDALRFDIHGIEGVSHEDIAEARVSNRRIRLVATCVGIADQVSGNVGVDALAPEDYLAAARGEENRVEIETRDGEIVRLSGRGAGRWPTARSVLSDVHAHLRAQLNVASTRREQHARRIETLGSSLNDELALHQAVVAGE